MTARRRDYDLVVGLYESGLSTGKLAKLFGVLPGTMRQVLQRRGVTFRPPSRLRFGADSYLFRHGLKVSAQQTHANNAVRIAVKNGKLTPQPCGCCGIDGRYANGRRKVQAHHDDYEAPLSVRWLCKSCHYRWHVNNDAGHRSGTQETKA